MLEPDPRSLTLRHGVVSLVLSLLLVAGAAAATVPSVTIAVVALALVLALGLVIVKAAWRESHTRLGVSDLGLLVQRGTRQDQVGWATVVAVTGQARHGRIRITVERRTGQIVPDVTFSVAPARRWLRECRAHAPRRWLEPRPGPHDLALRPGISRTMTSPTPRRDQGAATGAVITA